MTEQKHDDAGGASRSDAGLGMTDAEADAAQNWKGMNGATAMLIINRHADGWDDISAMMNAWLRANGGTVPNVELTGGALAPSSDRRERG